MATRLQNNSSAMNGDIEVVKGVYLKRDPAPGSGAHQKCRIRHTSEACVYSPCSAYIAVDTLNNSREAQQSWDEVDKLEIEKENQQ